MNKFYRITIVVLLVFVLILLANDRVGWAFNNVENPAENQQVQAPRFQATPTQSQSNPSQNQSDKAQLSGLVWNDRDQDGFQDLGEQGLRDVTVNLLDKSKTVIQTSTTDRNGVYEFKNLDPGEYFVIVFPPAGFVFSPKDQGVNELVDSDSDPESSDTPLASLAAGENDLVWTTGLYAPGAPVQAEAGTVQPPPTEVDTCVPGSNSLGGQATLQVNRLAADYCLHAFLWNHAFAIGRIPPGAGRVLADVTFLEVLYQDKFVYKYDVQGETDSIQICYAVPLGLQAQIYFFDFYGPRFGNPGGGPSDKPAWEPLDTTITNGIACATAQTSGAYALIGK